MFSTRNRAKDEALRGRYLRAIKAMLVPVQESLDVFNEAIAVSLGIEKKQAVSMYQMFKREYEKGQTKINLSFEYGRIVDMGD